MGYYDKIDSVLASSLDARHSFKREDIEQIARDHTVCPFELSLDMLSGADVVVCDYNYVFDPVVYLRRCFDEPIDEHSFLVDEVHNLVDRGRDMFSAQIEKERIVSVKALLKKNHHAGLADVMRKLDGLNRAFLALRKKHQEPLDRQGFAVIKEIPSPLIVKLQAFCDFLQCWLVENDRQSSHYSRLLELYFEALRFTRTAEFFDSHYVCLIKTGMKNALSIHLYCVNPARLLATGLARSKSTILFSATLTPINYYQQLLGVRPDTHFVDLPSPFPQHNQAVFVVKNIATNYRQRSDSYNNIAELIAATIRAHRGNYLVYFPSYQYMGDVYDVFRRQNPSEDTIVQQRHMDDDSRQSFLAHFDQANASGLVGFAVMGGIFGEGIDLKGSRLVGVIVVGVGLPQIGIERDLIKQHFSQSASDEAVPRQQDPDEGFSMPTSIRV